MDSNAVKDIDQYAEKARFFIDSEKFKCLIPGVHYSSPWSNDSLNECEMLFLRTQRENLTCTYEKYVMFLGEGLRRTFSGEWKRGDFLSSDLHSLIGIYYPSTKHFDVVSNFLQEALFLSSGKTWSASFAATNHLLSKRSSTKGDMW